MSWMDSWSRPRKDQAVPAPYYLTQGDSAQYCHTCGRVIGARRANTAKANSAVVKYCSDKCKRHKPSNADDSVEKQLEAALVELLEGRGVKPPPGESSNQDVAAVKAKYQPKKGDPRIIVVLSEVEEAVFGNRQDPEKTFGRRKNRARRGVPDGPEWKSVDMLDDGATDKRRQLNNATFDVDDYDDLSEGTDGSMNDGEQFETAGISLRIRPPQAKSDINFGVGGERGWAEKIEETPEMQQKRIDGVRKAEEKEMVKQMARRAVVFGLPVPRNDRSRQKDERRGKKKGRRVDEHDVDEGDMGPALKKCEALMNNTVVEPSFAKGDWSIRWREE